MYKQPHKKNKYSFIPKIPNIHFILTACDHKQFILIS